MNISFVTTRKTMREAQIDGVLHEINRRRFKGVFTIAKSHEGFWEMGHVTGILFALDVTLITRRRLHLKGIPGTFCSWVSWVFLEEIAKAVDGVCGDEGIPDRWRPDPQGPQFVTFLEYWDHTHGFMRNEKDCLSLRTWVEAQIKFWPEDLRQLAGI